MRASMCCYPAMLAIVFGFSGASFGAVARAAKTHVRQPPPSCTSTVLFRAGDRGYKCYRIPALVTTKRGTILAFCEARKHGQGDAGDIDLAMRRSTDGGQHWSEMRIIADDGAHTMGNPCPVVDASTGVIWVPLCRDNSRVLLMKSADDGQTWTQPADITEAAKDPMWRWVGTGPGHGIQLRSGRLVVPCWADHTERLGEIQFSYVFYSDDHGQTWTRGQPLDRNASDECEVVERVDGALYANMRSRGDKRQRAYATSSDGGRTWSAVKYDARLPEPSCQGSVTRFTCARRAGRDRVLLACAANPARRSHMTVRLSYDECRTWPVSKVVYPGSSAYCDLGVTSDGQILLLYEADAYSRIVLARFNLAWLTGGKDRLP